MRAPVVAGLLAALLTVVAVGCGEFAPENPINDRSTPVGAPARGLVEVRIVAEYVSERAFFFEGGLVEIQLDGGDTHETALVRIGHRGDRTQRLNARIVDLIAGTYNVIAATRVCGPSGCNPKNVEERAGPPEDGCRGSTQLGEGRIETILIIVEPGQTCKVRDR